jgi:hypothetical protein
MQEWAMNLCGIAAVGHASRSSDDFPSLIFGYRLCRVMTVTLEVMRAQVNEERYRQKRKEFSERC